MYLRNGVLKALKVKNVLLIIGAVFFLIFSLVAIIDLFVTYHDDIDTALHAKSMPGLLEFVLISLIVILVAVLSRRLMGDARFYSSYFEGSLDGHITFKELSKASGMPVFVVAFELFFFRYIYMKKYSFSNVDGKRSIELYSKTTLCECKHCGAPVEKKDYFAGVCNYCGSSDVFAKVLAGDRFYSISSEVKKGKNRPDYYEHANLSIQKTLYFVLLIVGFGAALIALFMLIDSISNYNNEAYLNKMILDPSNNLYSKAAVRSNLNLLITFSIVFLIVFFFLAIRRILKIFYLFEAEESARYFSKCDKPFIPAKEIPLIKTKGNGKLRRVRGALRSGYLSNCTLEFHDEQTVVALAKKIVKDTCPSCAAPIIGAVDESYVCKVCGNKIMGVIEKK